MRDSAESHKIGMSLKVEEMSRFSLRPDVVNFKNHLDELSGQAYLLLLAD